MRNEESIELDEDWGRDSFLLSLVRELAGTLQEVVGLSESEGFISVVGQHIGERFDADYRRRLDRSRLDRKAVAEVLVDLKKRIQGDFYVIEETEESLVLGNRRCPFGDFVKGRPSLCMMTSNVFGTIAAENLGYARVALEETIARGDTGCRVVVYLSEQAGGPEPGDREYFSIAEAHDET